MLKTRKDVDNYIVDIKRKIGPQNRIQLKSRGYEFAKLYFDVGSYHDCKRYVKEFLEVRETSQAYKLFGQVLEAQGEKKDAIHAYRRSLQRDLRQKDLLLKLTELYSNPLISDIQEASSWLQEIESSFPEFRYSYSAFELEKRLINHNGNGDPERLAWLIKSYLEKNPQDINLHIQLVEVMIQLGHTEQAVNHAKDVDLSCQFVKSLKWYRCICNVYKLHQENVGPNMLDHIFYSHQLFALSRLACIAIEDTQSEIQLAQRALHQFDQCLYHACKQPVSQAWQDFLTEMKGRHAYMIAMLLLRRASKGQAVWKEATLYAAICFLLSGTSKPRDQTITEWAEQTGNASAFYKFLWQTHCDRLCQGGHMFDFILTNPGNLGKLEELLQKLSNKEEVNTLYCLVFSTKELKGKKDNSYLYLTNPFIGVGLRKPLETDLKRYDTFTFEIQRNNLKYLVWLALRNPTLSADSQQDYEDLFGIKFCPLLQEYNMFRDTTLFPSQLDVKLFFWACVRWVCLEQEKENNSRRSLSEKPDVLPVFLTKNVLTNQQCEWWDKVQNIGNQNNITGLPTIDQSSVISWGLETVRLARPKALPLTLIVHLATSMDAMIKKTDDYDDDDYDDDDDGSIEEIRNRSATYWKEADDIVQRMERHSGSIYPKEMLFCVDTDHEKKMLQDLKAKVTYAIGMLQQRDGNMRGALKKFESLRSPQANYQAGMVYQTLAEGADDSDSEADNGADENTDPLDLLLKAQGAFHRTINHLGDDEEQDLRLKHVAEMKLSEVSKQVRALTPLHSTTRSNDARSVHFEQSVHIQQHTISHSYGSPNMSTQSDMSFNMPSSSVGPSQSHFQPRQLFGSPNRHTGPNIFGSPQIPNGLDVFGSPQIPNGPHVNGLQHIPNGQQQPYQFPPSPSASPPRFMQRNHDGLPSVIETLEQTSISLTSGLSLMESSRKNQETLIQQLCEELRQSRSEIRTVQEEMRTIRGQYQQRENEIREDAEKGKKEKDAEIAKMKEQNKKEIKNLKQQTSLQVEQAQAVAKAEHKMDLENLRFSLTQKQVADMQEQMTAHRASLEQTRQEVTAEQEQLKQAAIQDCADQARINQDELINSYTMRINQINAEHQSELAQILEIQSLKEAEYKETLEGKDQEIDSLKENIDSLEAVIEEKDAEIQERDTEIQERVDEIETMRLETQEEIRTSVNAAIDSIQRRDYIPMAEHHHDMVELERKFAAEKKKLDDQIKTLKAKQATDMVAHQREREANLEKVSKLESDVITMKNAYKILHQGMVSSFCDPEYISTLLLANFDGQHGDQARSRHPQQRSESGGAGAQLPNGDLIQLQPDVVDSRAQLPASKPIQDPAQSNNSNQSNNGQLQATGASNGARPKETNPKSSTNTTRQGNAASSGDNNGPNMNPGNGNPRTQNPENSSKGRKGQATATGASNGARPKETNPLSSTNTARQGNAASSGENNRPVMNHENGTPRTESPKNSSNGSTDQATGKSNKNDTKKQPSKKGNGKLRSNNKTQSAEGRNKPPSDKSDKQPTVNEGYKQAIMSEGDNQPTNLNNGNRTSENASAGERTGSGKSSVEQDQSPDSSQTTASSQDTGTSSEGGNNQPGINPDNITPGKNIDSDKTTDKSNQPNNASQTTANVTNQDSEGLGASGCNEEKESGINNGNTDCRDSDLNGKTDMESSGGSNTTSAGGTNTSSAGGTNTSSAGGSKTSSEEGTNTSSSGGTNTSSTGGTNTSSAGGTNTFSSGGSNTSSTEGSSTSSAGGTNTSRTGGTNTSRAGGTNTSSAVDINTSITGGSNTSSAGGRSLFGPSTSNTGRTNLNGDSSIFGGFFGKPGLVFGIPGQSGFNFNPPGFGGGDFQFGTSAQPHGSSFPYQAQPHGSSFPFQGGLQNSSQQSGNSTKESGNSKQESGNSTQESGNSTQYSGNSTQESEDPTNTAKGNTSDTNNGK